jgi:hypothetical protein
MKPLLFFVCIWAEVAYGQYSLELNLEKGNAYFLKITSIIQLSAESNGQKMSIASTITAYTKFKVVQASALGYDLEGNYDSMHMSVKTATSQLEYSSCGSCEQANMAGSAPGSMHSSPIKLTLLKNGAVSRIENPDSSGFSALLKQFPMAEGIKKMLMLGHFKNAFSGQAMKQNMEKVTALFPNKKVALNESWGTTIEADSTKPLRIQTSYQLVDYQSGFATIKGHSESKSSKPQKQVHGFGGLPLNCDLDGVSESTIQVNAATGWIKQADIRNDLKGHLELTNSGQNQGKPLTIQITSNTSISSY